MADEDEVERVPLEDADALQLQLFAKELELAEKHIELIKTQRAAFGQHLISKYEMDTNRGDMVDLGARVVVRRK